MFKGVIQLEEIDKLVEVAERGKQAIPYIGRAWTVDLLRFDILTNGFVVFCEDYYKEEVDANG